MKLYLKIFLAFIAVSAGFVGFWFGLKSAAKEKQIADIVFIDKLNQWEGELTNLDTTKADLAFTKGPLLINFWGTWCPPCRHELPLFEKVSLACPDSLVGIAVDRPEPAAAYWQEKEFTFTTYVANLEGVQLLEQIGNTASAMPYTILVDEVGKVVRSKAGPFANAEQIVEFMSTAITVNCTI